MRRHVLPTAPSPVTTHCGGLLVFGDMCVHVVYRPLAIVWVGSSSLTMALCPALEL